MRFLSAAVLVGGLGVCACGLRSNPLDDFDGEIDLTESPDPVDEGSCGMPKTIPAQFETFTLSGQLSGEGSEVGSCGRDEGPEGVYAFTPAADGDVTIRVDAAQTSMRPTIRVERDVCGDPTRAAELCAWDFLGQEGSVTRDRHFFARAGSTYFVTIDSEAQTRGNYEIELRTGTPPLDQCGVHAETIVYSPGGSFSWLNDFTAGYGRVSSRCGAPGKENMFRLVVDRPGWVMVEGIGSGGFIPVLSLRTSCSTVSEIDCTQPAGNRAAGEWFVEAGTYYLTIDNGSTAAGGYDLRVNFG